MRIVQCFLYNKPVSLSHCRLVNRNCKYRGGTFFEAQTLREVEELYGKEIKVIKPTVCIIDGKFVRGQ